MTLPLPAPPPEPPPQRDLASVAPKLQRGLTAALEEMRSLGHDPIVAEAIRSADRQAWLFGFGREYDDPGDPRGVVTNAPTGLYSWHTYGCAVDVESEQFGDAPPGEFWFHLGKCVEKRGLTWGGRWIRFTDRPHVQLGPPMRQSPSIRSSVLCAQGGNEAVWRAVGGL